MTKKDMTEIAQVLANGVVRVYMGPEAAGAAVYPAGLSAGTTSTAAGACATAIRQLKDKK